MSPGFLRLPGFSFAPGACSRVFFMQSGGFADKMLPICPALGFQVLATSHADESMTLRRFLILGRSGEIGKLSDLELVGRFKADANNQCFEEVFERHWARIFNIAFSILRDEGLAEDAVQSTFERAYREIQSFDESKENSNLQQWLACICRNICLDELRRRRTRLALSPLVAPDGSATPANGEESLLIREALELLDTLDEPYRICYLLKMQRYSYEEIMSMTGYSFEQVKARIRTAHRNLVRKFEGQRT